MHIAGLNPQQQPLYFFLQRKQKASSEGRREDWKAGVARPTASEKMNPVENPKNPQNPA
jgi:hypothetical protein